MSEAATEAPVYSEAAITQTLTEKLQASHVAAVDLSDGCGSKVSAAAVNAVSQDHSCHIQRTLLVLFRV